MATYTPQIFGLLVGWARHRELFDLLPVQRCTCKWSPALGLEMPMVAFTVHAVVAAVVKGGRMALVKLLIRSLSGDRFWRTHGGRPW